MRLIDADELKKQFRVCVPMGAAFVKIIDEARTITIMDEAPACIDCDYKEV